MHARRSASCATALTLALLNVPDSALAQVAPQPRPPQPQPAPAPPAPAPVPEPAYPEDSAGAASAGMAMPQYDSAEVVAEYDRAFELLVAGRYAAAAALFDAVAARAETETRGAMARELARLARRLGSAGAGAPAAAGAAASFDDGRADFIVATTLASFYAGFVLDDLFDVVDTRAQTLVVAGSTAIGFASSVFGTRGKRISGGMSESFTLGLYSGLANGLLLAPMLGIDPGSAGSSDGDVNESYVTFGLLTMAAGGAAGAYFGHTVEPTRAQARVASILGGSGAATAGLVLAIVQPDDIEAETVTAIIACGFDLGVGAGIYLAPRIEWSTSRASLVLLSEFLGVVGGVTVAVLVFGEDGPSTDSDASIAAATLLGGMWGGFALGAHFTRDMAPDVRFRGDATAPGRATEPASPTATSSSWRLAPIMAGRSPGIGIAGSF